MQEKKSILVVDDNADNLHLLGDLLQTVPEYDVLVADNGPQALRICDEQKVDLVLLDILMPGMDGYVVCKSLKENPKTQVIPIIFISALNASHEQIQGYLEGGADYITKPFRAHDVLTRIRVQLKLEEVMIKQKETEQEKSKADDLMQRSQHFSRVGSWIWHLADNRLEWSDEMYLIFGVDPLQFSGNLNEIVEKVIHPEDLPKVKQLNEIAMKHDRPQAAEYRIVLQNGVIKHVWASPASWVNDADGKRVYLTGFVQDITHFKRVEHEADEANERFLAAFELSSDAMVIMDENVSIVKANGVFNFTFSMASMDLWWSQIKSLIFALKGSEESATTLTLASKACRVQLRLLHTYPKRYFICIKML
jgi:PAS domain S-box-containing protein